jgi:hypothetical protein
VNHGIPFPESEVEAKDRYRSHFMVEFLRRVGAQPESLAQSPPSSQSPSPATSRTSRTSRETFSLAARIAPKVREHGFLK